MNTRPGRTSTDDQGFGNDDATTAASPEAELGVLPVTSAAVVRVFAAAAASVVGAFAPLAASGPRWPFVLSAADVPGLASAEVSAFPGLASCLASPAVADISGPP